MIKTQIKILQGIINNFSWIRKMHLYLKILFQDLIYNIKSINILHLSNLKKKNKV